MTTLKIGHIIKYIVLIFLTILFLIPIYVVIITSLKPLDEVTLAQMWSLPSSIDFSSYTHAFSRLAPNLLNSFYLVIPATLLAAILGSMNGYVLSKWKFKGSDILFTFLLFGMFLSYQSILITFIYFFLYFYFFNIIFIIFILLFVYMI